VPKPRAVVGSADDLIIVVQCCRRTGDITGKHTEVIDHPARIKEGMLRTIRDESAAGNLLIAVDGVCIGVRAAKGRQSVHRPASVEESWR
jgi:hypothetical protein